MKEGTSSDLFQVRGHSEHIIAQTTKEHMFFIVVDYGNFSAREELKLITDDPRDLQEWFSDQVRPPRPR